MRVPVGTGRVTSIRATTVLGIALVLGGCSGGDDPATADGGPTTTLLGTPATTQPPTADPTLPAEPVDDTVPDETAIDATDPTDPTDPPLTTNTLVEVSETGVPGLDSDDSFCAAWSRFGGSWQVIQVAANFAPDPAIVPVMEVVAAPVVAASYDQMLAAWPDDLAGERDAVADAFFGPLDRRAEAALDALVTAGATDDDLEALGSAWVDALAARQSDDPVLVPELDDDLDALVRAAAAEFDAQRVDFVDDPSMRITVETPRTDAYLATACPDQGALTGGEVDGG